MIANSKNSTSPNDIALFHRRTLRSNQIRRDRVGTGIWMAYDISPKDLYSAVHSLENTPKRILKSSHINRVLVGELLGESVILKRYDLPRLRHQFKYVMRPSRGRRAWASALTLKTFEIPTTPCLGFFECRTKLPNTSYVVFRFEPDVVSARKWIKAWLHQRPDEFRTGFGNDLTHSLLALYRLGIYHADTKSSNILVRAPEDPEKREFLWIDLECVQFDVSLSRRKVMRNLVQLNGSIGAKLSDRDRLEFLHGLSEMFPWVQDPHVAERIRTWTHERLKREQTGQCGP